MWGPVLGGGAGSAPAPCSRAKHSATLLGGHLYVLGGRSSGNVPLRDFWRYSLAEGAWERLETRGRPHAPPALQEHSAVARGAQLYVFGGELGYSSSETPLWRYDTQTMWWQKLGGGGGSGAAPRGRRGHSAHVLGDVMLIYGGYQDLKGSSNEMWAFHFESESWHRVAAATAAGGAGGGAPPRHRHAAALHDRRLYVHAGMHDLRECADMWKYDTVSRSWCQLRCKVSPGALHGHVAVRVPGYLYVFGGESGPRLNNELWKFHFGTETWERVVGHGSWPAPRADACALLTSELPLRAQGCRRARADLPSARALSPPDPPSGFLREITKMSQFNLRRGNSRCSYTVLSGERDSTESLARPSRAPSPPPPAPRSMVKSQSAYAIGRRRPLSCGAVRSGERVPREADGTNRAERPDISREPISVPDFADLVLPTPVLSPLEVTKLVYLDSEEEEEMRREDGFSPRPRAPSITAVTAAPAEPAVRRIEVAPRGDGSGGGRRRCEAIPKSASVRFRAHPDTEDESELSTSDYASAERVNRLSSTSTYSGGGGGGGGGASETAFGFCNPHYLGPDVQEILGGAVALNTPDSGVGEAACRLPGAVRGGDVELVELADLGRGRARTRAHVRARARDVDDDEEEREPPALLMLLVGGRETPHAALMQRPLALWSYRL